MYFRGSFILHYHKELLREFWATYGHQKNGIMTSRKVPSHLPKEKVLDGLRDFQGIKLDYKSTHSRADFDKRKHQRQFNGFKFCFACKKPAQIRHHIISIKNGGRNQKNNIVGLCRSCHAEVHPWL